MREDPLGFGRLREEDDPSQKSFPVAGDNDDTFMAKAKGAMRRIEDETKFLEIRSKGRVSSYTKKGSSKNPLVYVRNVKTDKKVGPVTQAQADELIQAGQAEAL